MSFKVFLKFTEGSWKKEELSFDEKVSRSLGRSSKCDCVLPDDYDGVSGQHCLLDIDPPIVIVNDLNSLNGTFLNGEMIGQRSDPPQTEDIKRFLMRTGDRLSLGKNCEIRLRVEFPGSCAQRSCDYFPRPDEGYPLCSKCDKKINNLCNQSAGYIYSKLLGEGCMGEVWLIQDATTGERKAMKLIHQAQSTNETITNWFIREMKIGEQITHPNIVQQYQSGHDGKYYYILLEYCRGGNLADFLRREDVTHIFRNDIHEGLKIATHIILQTLDGLDYIHHVPVEMTSLDGMQTTKGLVHRDIKPANLLLSDISLYPHVKIGDLGLTKAFQLAGFTDASPTPDDFYGGFRGFIPVQQQMYYRYVEPDVDVWAAAAVYYYMLTGHLPKDPVENCTKKSAIAGAVPIRARDSRIPEQLAAVIDKALVDNPDIEIKDAKELKTMIIEATR